MAWSFYDTFLKKNKSKSLPQRRISTEDNNAVIFDECRSNIFHGYVAEWGELSDQHRILLHKNGWSKTMKIDNNGK